MEQLVVIGGGQCAGQAITSLRQGGYEGRIVLVADEPLVPYQRPPLSKQYLAGDMALEKTFVRPPAFYADNAVELELGTRAVAIDRDRGRVVLDGGRELGFDRLLLATGSRPRALAVPGADLDGVLYLRSVADADALRARLSPGARLVVVGGGYVGLEVAAVAAKAGVAVTVLEAMDRLLARVTSSAIAEHVAHLHAGHGVDVRCRAAVTGFEGASRVEGVRCGDERIEADLVVIGIGIVPNVELARDAGLETDNGIVVDERCRTADQRIFAAGDCTNHPNPLLGRRLRLESVHNALAQGRAAAANLRGEDAPYAEMPWFWSEQYDMRLQMVGLSDGHDRVVRRGEADAEEFVLLYLRDGTLIAADAVSQPREFMVCRKLVETLPRVDPERLADPDVALKDLL